MILEKSHACILVAAAAALGAGIGASGSRKAAEEPQRSAQGMVTAISAPAPAVLPAASEPDGAVIARRLKFGSRTLSVELPKGAVAKGCASGAGAGPDYTTCVFSDTSGTGLVIAVTSAIMRDVFLPLSWHMNAVTEVEQTPVLDRNEQLRNTFEKSFRAVLLETDFLAQDRVEGAFGVIGRVPKISVGGVSLSSVYCGLAFGLATNRGVRVLYCADNKDGVVNGLGGAMRSLRESNPSVEYKGGSFIEREHEAYVARADASSVGDKQILSDEEKSYESNATITCAGAPKVSVEYYQCREAQARIRFGELKQVRVYAAAPASQREPDPQPAVDAKAPPLQNSPPPRESNLF